jgi:trans-aconitate methyltransferase
MREERLLMCLVKRLLRTKEFLSSLPQSVLKGEDILIPDKVVRKLFRFAGLRRSDIFYDLGCGNSSAVAIAANEFKVKKSVGIEIRRKVAIEARRKVVSMDNAQIIIGDIRKAAISDATVLFFWFTDPRVIEPMVCRFQNELNNGARVITILSPPDHMLPTKTKFPFFVFQKPFKYAKQVQEQIEVIFGKPCIDFVESWLMAEKYIDELDVVPDQHRRFVNMFQSMIIWINAWNTGVACEKEIPPPVYSYLGILKTFFAIDLSDLISKKNRN